MSDELAFIQALSKTAGPRASLAKHVLKKIPGLLKKHKLPIGVAALGAAIAGGGTYLAAKPKKDGGLSQDQEQARAVVDSLKGSDGLVGGAARAWAKGGKELSDVVAKHPKKTALLAAPIGAVGALRILRALKE